MIKGNFDVKKIDKEKHSETEEFEELIQKAGYGSHMVFKNKKSEDDFFLEEI